MRVTMEDVARAAGVNRATVSRALKGPNRLINEQTRLRILSVAAQLGYRKDPFVSTLMAQRRDPRGASLQGVLAIVSFWPNNSPQWSENAFFEPLRQSLAARSERAGFASETFLCDGSAVEVRALQRVLRARGVQAVVFAPSQKDLTSLPLDVSEFASAYIGPGIREPHLNRVIASNGNNLRLAYATLRARGHRRIGLATWSELTDKNEGTWVGAYLHKLWAEGSEPILFEWLKPVPNWGNGEDRALLQWVQAHKPDAILSHDVVVLDKLRRAYPTLGLYTLEHTPGWPFSGIDDNRHQFGEAAVDSVVAQIHRGERGVPAYPKIIQIEGRWREAE